MEILDQKEMTGLNDSPLMNVVGKSDDKHINMLDPLPILLRN